MTFDGALIKEQGTTFAVVIVERHVLNTNHTANNAITSFRPLFPGVPIVLAAQDAQGRPSYYGREDIVQFLAHTPFTAIPWRRYHLN